MDKKRLLIRVDNAMLDLANAWLVKFQDATGIPKWKVERLAVGAWGAMVVVEGVVGHHVWMIVFGPFLLLFSVIAISERMRQKRADRTMMPIASENRDGFMMRALRLLWSFLILIAPIDLLRDRWTLSTFRDVVIFLTVFLMSCDTWPMIGGATIKDRIKKMFTSRPMVAAKSET